MKEVLVYQTLIVLAFLAVIVAGGEIHMRWLS
jgi:hypothetical protein